MTEGTADRRVDDALDKILRAAGCGKLSNYMPYSQDRLREAMREVLALRCEQATGPDRELDLAIGALALCTAALHARAQMERGR